MISGSLLINKEKGLSSRQEVNNISRLLGEKKAGHIGTLDPFADGLLIVLLGRSTKISSFLEGMDKTYLATLKLGVQTDSGDLTGKEISRREIPALSKQIIEEVFKSFLGEQDQLPPMYSALKINGKELYKYARQGQEIERNSRKITIYELKLISIKDDEITFLSKVSKGTYIRTLGEDIAVKLGTVGHLTSLTRLAVGPFSLENAKASKDVKIDDLIPVEKMLSFMKTYEVSGDLIKLAKNGMHFRLPINYELVLLTVDKKAIAIYKRELNGVYSCVRGLL